MRGPRRSTRSYVVELGFTVLAILAVWSFLQLGGPSVVGHWIGPMFAPTQ